MKRIIENEIYKIIKRFPDDTELNSVIEYLDFFADDSTDADSLRTMISDWCNEYMCQCEHCGKWHLKEEMLECYGTYYCDEVCKYDHDAFTYDMAQLEQDEYRFNVLNA